MINDEIWYKSTLGYEGQGIGENTTAIFREIARILKTFAPSGNQPSLIVGDRAASNIGNTTHIEQTYAIRLEKGMEKVVQTAINEFFKNSYLTKDNSAYQVFSQGQATSLTKPLSYLTQSSAISEAKREVSGTMSQVFTQGGKPYITVVGDTEDELTALSKGGFKSLVPSARGIQHTANLAAIRKDRERQAKLDAKEAARQAKIDAQIAAEEARENQRIIDDAAWDRPRQDRVRDKYYRKQHGERYAVYKRGQDHKQFISRHITELNDAWYKRYHAEEDLANAIAFEPDDEPRVVGGSSSRDLQIQKNRREDNRTKEERHKSNLRVFSAVAGGISLLVAIATKIFNLMGKLYSGTAEAATQAVTNARTARNLGIDPYALNRYSSLAVEKGLDKNIFTNVFSDLQSRFGDITVSKDALPDSSFMAVVGDAAGDLIKGGITGQGAEKYTRIILDSYLRNYNNNRNALNNIETDPALRRTSLYNSLAKFSPEMAEIFGAMVDTGSTSFEDFKKSSRKGNTGFSSSDLSVLEDVGELVNVFRSFIDDMKSNIFAQMANSLGQILEYVMGIAKWMNKETRFENKVDAVLANKETLERIQADKKGALAVIDQQLKGKIYKDGSVLGGLDDLMQKDPNFATYLANLDDPEVKAAMGFLNYVNEKEEETKERIRKESLVQTYYTSEQAARAGAAYMAEHPFVGDVAAMNAPTAFGLGATGMAYNSGIGGSQLVGIPEWAQNTYGGLAGMHTRGGKYKDTEAGKRWSKVSGSPLEVAKRIYELAQNAKEPRERVRLFRELSDFLLANGLNLDQITGGSEYAGMNRDDASLNTYQILQSMASGAEQQLNVMDAVSASGLAVTPENISDFKYQFPTGGNDKQALIDYMLKAFTGATPDSNMNLNLKIDIDGKEAANVSMTSKNGEVVDQSLTSLNESLKLQASMQS